jgi:hypothetical protein
MILSSFFCDVPNHSSQEECFGQFYIQFAQNFHLHDISRFCKEKTLFFTLNAGHENHAGRLRERTRSRPAAFLKAF